MEDCEEGQEYFDDRNRRFRVLGYNEDFDPEKENKDIVVLAKVLDKGVLKIAFYARSYSSSATAKEIANHFALNGARKTEFKNNYENAQLKKVCEIEYPPNLILEEAVLEHKEKEMVKNCLLRLYSTYPDHL